VGTIKAADTLPNSAAEHNPDTRAHISADDSSNATTNRSAYS
jgi:hypothetical protein